MSSCAAPPNHPHTLLEIAVGTFVQIEVWGKMALAASEESQCKGLIPPHYPTSLR